MKEVSDKDTDFYTDSQESEFNNDLVDCPSMLASPQPPPSNSIITTLSIDSVKIDSEYEQMAPQMSEKDFQAFKESIKKQHGLYLPIVVNNNNVLLDGHHRLKACNELQIKEVPVLVFSFNDKLDEKLFIYESAGKRRNLDEYSKYELALKTEELLKEIANQNRLANLKQNQNNNSNSNYQSPTHSFVQAQICHALAVMAATIGIQGSVIFIDTQGTFRPERIVSIADARDFDTNSILSNILYINTTTSRQQELAIDRILSTTKKNGNTKLLIVDSVIANYRAGIFW